MPETLSVRPRICQQIRSGPLGQWIDDFVDVLTTRGYATSVVRRHVRAAAVSAWLERQRVAATEIDEPLVARFISGLPRWGSPKRRPNRVSEVAGGVGLTVERPRRTPKRQRTGSASTAKAVYSPIRSHEQRLPIRDHPTAVEGQRVQEGRGSARGA